MGWDLVGVLGLWGYALEGDSETPAPSFPVSHFLAMKAMVLLCHAPLP